MSTKRNLTLALLAATITPWAYPSAAAKRQNPYAGFGVADISTALAARERARPNTGGREASAALDPDSTLPLIKNSTHADRMRVAGTVEAAVDAASKAAVTLQDHATELPGTNREQFQEAMRQALSIEAQVRGSLQTLRVSTEDNHAEARDKLASDYESYANAIGDLEAISRNAVGTF
jgi:hypothetical protein